MEKKLLPNMIFRSISNRLTLKANRGPIGVGLIGVGGWGGTNAVNIMRSRRFNVSCAYDKRAQTASRFAKRFGIKDFERMDSLLCDADIQAIVATVPNHFHAEVVKAAADAGKHIFIDKPLASCPNICRELGLYCKKRSHLAGRPSSAP